MFLKNATTNYSSFWLCCIHHMIFYTISHWQQNDWCDDEGTWHPKGGCVNLVLFAKRKKTEKENHDSLTNTLVTTNIGTQSSQYLCMYLLCAFLFAINFTSFKLYRSQVVNNCRRKLCDQWRKWLTGWKERFWQAAAELQLNI